MLKEQNILDVNLNTLFKNNKMGLLINIIIPLFTMVMLIISIVGFERGKSNAVITDGIVKNQSAIKLRNDAFYYLLLTSAGCVAITLRVLINNNWMNLVGIFLILGFMIFTHNSDMITICVDSYDNQVKSSKKKLEFSIYEYINLGYFMYNKLNKIPYQRELPDSLSQEEQPDILKKTNVTHNRPTWSLLRLVYLIVSITTAVCFAVLINRDLKFNLRSIGLVITSIVFILNIVYFILDITTESPVFLHLGKKTAEFIEYFIKNNKEFLNANKLGVFYENDEQPDINKGSEPLLTTVIENNN